MSRSIPHTLAVALVVTGASLSLAIGAQAQPRLSHLRPRRTHTRPSAPDAP
jgi:hypothetical protein